MQHMHSSPRYSYLLFLKQNSNILGETFAWFREHTQLYSGITPSLFLEISPGGIWGSYVVLGFKSGSHIIFIYFLGLISKITSGSVVLGSNLVWLHEKSTLPAVLSLQPWTIHFKLKVGLWSWLPIQVIYGSFYEWVPRFTTWKCLSVTGAGTSIPSIIRVSPPAFPLPHPSQRH